MNLRTLNFNFRFLLPFGLIAALSGGDWQRITPDFAKGDSVSAVAFNGSLYVAAGNRRFYLSSDGMNWDSDQSQEYNHLGIHSLIWNGSFFLGRSLNSTLLKSTDGVNWDALCITAYSRDLDWDGSRFISVGDSGLVLSSGDGEVWEEEDSGTNQLLRAIASNGTRNVAVGESGTLITSDGGGKWIARASGTSNHITDIDYSGDQFIAVAGDKILTSVDGELWNVQDSPNNTSLASVSCNGSSCLFYNSGTLFESSDLFNWNQQIISSQWNIEDMKWIGGQWVLVGSHEESGYWSSPLFLTSPNGDQWTPRDPETPASLTAVAWTGTHFVAVGGRGAALQSENGSQWTARHTGTQATLRDLLWTGTELLAVGEEGTVLASADGSIWTARNTGTESDLYALAQSDSRFVAVGDDGSVVTSDDGSSWTELASLTFNTFNAVAWGDGQFVAVGSWGSVFTSSDGETWVDRSPHGVIEEIFDVAYDGSRWTAVGNRVTLTSANGFDWSDQTSIFSSSMSAVEWDGARFMACGNDGLLVSSTDGKFWENHSFGSTVQLLDMASNGQQWVAVGVLGTILTSSNRVTWQAEQLYVEERYNAVAFGGGEYVAVGDRGALRTSSDGSHWQARYTGQYEGNLQDLAFHEDQWVVVGRLGAAGDGLVLTSRNGIDWENPSTHAEGLSSIARGGSLWVAVGLNGTVITSPDGDIWTPATSGTTVHLNDVMWDGTRFLATADDGDVLTSANGINWAVQSTLDIELLDSLTWNGDQYTLSSGYGWVWTSEDAVQWDLDPHLQVYEMTEGDNLVVAVGVEGLVLTSPDGKTWTPRESQTPQVLRGVAWSGSRFVAVGHGGTIVTSSDGITWQAVDPGTNLDLFELVWAGSQFVASGEQGMVLTSPDGLTWTQVPPFTNQQIRALIWDGAKVIADAWAENMFTSPDGQTWTNTGFSSPRLEFHLFNGTSYMALGDFGNSKRIYTSNDGIDWTYQPAEICHLKIALAWSGTHWLLSVFGDQVYSSTDGSQWQRHYSGGDFVAMYKFSGGVLGATLMGSIFSSTDGLTWTPEQQGLDDHTFWDIIQHMIWKGDGYIASSNEALYESDENLHWKRAYLKGWETINGIAVNDDGAVAVGAGVIHARDNSLNALPQGYATWPDSPPGFCSQSRPTVLAFVGFLNNDRCN